VAHNSLQAFIDEYFRILISGERREVEDVVGLGSFLRFAHRNDDTLHVVWNWVRMIESLVDVEVVFNGFVVDGCVVGCGSDGSGDSAYSFWGDNGYGVESLLFFFQSPYANWSIGSFKRV
jgi:hypothetical protein